MGYRYGKFTWFEHVSNDKAKAAQFYQGLFGWKLQALPLGAGSYDMIHNGDTGIGGFVADSSAAAHWASWISVADVDATYAKALASGAKPAMPPRDYGDIGRGATFLDPAGARISVWHGRQGDREDEDEDDAPAGDWVWDELSTPDPQTALAFYETVFGYAHDDMDVGEHGVYHIIKTSDGRARGGVMQLPDAGMRPQWMPYVRVEDADDIASKIAPLGGKLLMPPTDIAAVGRIGMLIDPLGAALGFIRPAVNV